LRRKIDLTRCTNVSDAAIVSLAQACNDLQELIVFACPKVRHHISCRVVLCCVVSCRVVCANKERGLVQITNASIFGVLPEHCTALRALSLSRCRLTDTAASGGLARLLARAPELEELGLGRCKRIADSALAAIGTAPPRLTRAAPPCVVSLIVFCVVVLCVVSLVVSCRVVLQLLRRALRRCSFSI
jgi:hypothetical protein